MIISNAFSLNMVELPANLLVNEIGIEEVASMAKAGQLESAIGHKTTTSSKENYQSTRKLAAIFRSSNSRPGLSHVARICGGQL